MSRIYIAGPLSSPDPAQRLANVQAAIDAGIQFLKQGHAVYIPHLTAFVEDRSQETGAGLSYEDWIRTDLVWLDCCDGVLCLGRSPGTDRELTYAQQGGIPIYWDLSEIPSRALAGVS